MISFKVSGMSPGSVPTRIGVGVSDRKQSLSQPSAHRGAERLSALLGSDWTDAVALAGLWLFIGVVAPLAMR